MSQDVISVVPHTSSMIFRRAACTLQTRADLPMSIRSDIATPAEVHTVDPTIPVELHLMLEEFVSLVTVVIFTALTLCYTATFILRPLCQYTLSAILVRVKHWYSFKKISLPFSGLYSHTFRKLFEPLNLSFSNLLFLYTHTHTHTQSSGTLLQTTGGQKSTTTTGLWDSGGVHKNTQHQYLRCKLWVSPGSKKCRARCICTHRKVARSASKIPQGSPRERKLFQEPIPLPLLKAFKKLQFFTGIPHRQGKMLKGSSLPQHFNHLFVELLGEAQIGT